MKHTPGPWKIMQCLPKQVSFNGETETVIVDKNNQNILNRADITEEAANARLITAAPETEKERNELKILNAELLKALKYARRFLNEKDHDIEFVDMVIHKAEGKEDSHADV